MSPVMPNDAIQAFAAFLVLLLVLMLYGIIRAPANAGDNTAVARQAVAIPSNLAAPADLGAVPAPRLVASVADQSGMTRPAGARYEPKHARRPG